MVNDDNTNKVGEKFFTFRAICTKIFKNQLAGLFSQTEMLAATGMAIQIMIIIIIIKIVIIT